MYIEETEKKSCWYVVHTHPKQEDRAEFNLQAWKVETFKPSFRERRSHPFTGEPFYVTKPLFTRYIFARFDLESHYHKIRFTRGIHSLVSFGGNPIPVDDEIINAIRSRTGKDGLVKIGGDLRPGDAVEIKDGPLKGFTGIFEREMKESERVMVLLDTVNYQARVQIEGDLLSRAKAS